MYLCMSEVFFVILRATNEIYSEFGGVKYILLENY